MVVETVDHYKATAHTNLQVSCSWRAGHAREHWSFDHPVSPATRGPRDGICGCDRAGNRSQLPVEQLLDLRAFGLITLPFCKVQRVLAGRSIYHHHHLVGTGQIRRNELHRRESGWNRPGCGLELHDQHPLDLGASTVKPGG